MAKVTNKYISEILAEIADILEMRDENQFKIRAYRRATREIEEHPKNVAAIKDSKKLQKIPGIGESIAQKIIEISETGTCEYYEQLKNTIPVKITELNRLEGIGPKKILKLYEELGITNATQLEKAAKAGKVRKLEGFQEKTEQNILKSIESFRKHGARFRLDEALFYTQSVVEKLQKHKATQKVEIAGSIRRRRETIGDGDILIQTNDPKASMEHFTSLDEIARVIAKGDKKSTVEFENGFQADLRSIDAKSWGAALQYFTGDKAHNIALRSIVKKKGWKLNEYGLFDKSGDLIAGKTEEEIYKKLGMETPPPEIRRHDGEIKAAASANLPKLVRQSDIKGDFQIHTIYSDGIHTPEEMAKAAFELGFEYIAITEHNTKGLEVAGGVDDKDIPSYVKKVKRQMSNVYTERSRSVKCLASLEVNISKDGTLTVPDKYLAMLDYVLIAIHSNFRMEKAEMTKRILASFDNPYVHAFAHPTGRLLLRRDGYDLDFEAVCKKAAEKNIALELNAHPERLDLDGEHAKLAKSLGCKFVIGTDSHSTAQLANFKYGVYMARRGWLERDDILNTLPYPNLVKYLKKH